MMQIFGTNYDMQILYQVIVKILIQLIMPHYVLVVLMTYVYKPRLAHMIYRFKEDLMNTNKIVKSYALAKKMSPQF
jgi:hypothetical protein